MAVSNGSRRSALELDITQVAARYEATRLRRSRRFLLTCFGLSLAIGVAGLIAPFPPATIWQGRVLGGGLFLLTAAYVGVCYLRVPKAAVSLTVDENGVETRTSGGRTYRDRWTGHNLAMVAYDWSSSPWPVLIGGIESVKVRLYPNPRVVALIDMETLQAIRSQAAAHGTPVTDWVTPGPKSVPRLTIGPHSAR
jgi:hypothetical protein